METQERFPQGLGNLAQNAGFPHSHKPIIIVVMEKRPKNENSNNATTPSTESDQAQSPNIAPPSADILPPTELQSSGMPR
jgi:hypothetical protein